METTPVTMDPDEALELYKGYLKDRYYADPIDMEIRRTYKALSQGKTVIRALESIVKAGVNEQGLPKLAIVRADQKTCICDRERDGSFALYPPSHARWNSAAEMHFRFPTGSLPAMNDPRGHGGWWRDYEALVPPIPHKLRPKRALESYHILWEAEWSRVIPKDPYLLRRLGKGDLWLVVAAWDLTEVERAALQARVSVN
jgi:hypothetical protein